MKNSILGLAIVTAALTLTAAHAAQDVLRLRQPFVLNGVEVQPGDYRVTVSPSLDSVQLTVGTKVVASSPCKVSPVATPVRRDEVFSRPNAGGRDEIVNAIQCIIRDDVPAEKVTDELKEGDEVLVKVLEIDRQGKIRLSRKEAMREKAK